MNYQKALERYLLEYDLHGSSSWLRHFKTNLKQFFSFTQKEVECIEFTDFIEWLKTLSESGYMPSTLKAKVISLKLFFRFCFEEGWINNNPANKLPIPKLPRKLPKYLTMIQLNELRKIAKDHTRNRAIIETLFATGLRVSELTDIQLSHIKWKSSRIEVMGKGLQEREALFSSTCEAWLRKYLLTRKGESSYLFLNEYYPTPLKPHTIQIFFRDYSEQLGFKVTPHMLRHTFAACFAEKGIPIYIIQKLLGHKERHNTMIYTKLYSDVRRKMYDSFF